MGTLATDGLVAVAAGAAGVTLGDATGLGGDAFSFTAAATGGLATGADGKDGTGDTDGAEGTGDATDGAVVASATVGGGASGGVVAAGTGGGDITTGGEGAF